MVLSPRDSFANLSAIYIHRTWSRKKELDETMKTLLTRLPRRRKMICTAFVKPSKRIEIVGENETVVDERNERSIGVSCCILQIRWCLLIIETMLLRDAGSVVSETRVWSKERNCGLSRVDRRRSARNFSERLFARGSRGSPGFDASFFR